MGIMDILDNLNGPEYDEPAAQSPEVPVFFDEASSGNELSAPVWPEEEELIASLKKRPRIRVEAVMAGIALLAAAVLGLVIFISMPYFGAGEDPELLPHKHEAIQATLPPAADETLPAPTEEPTVPTIPPDPNPYGRNDFQYNRSNYLLLQNVESYAGVDVSAYQGDIDWDAVAKSGIEFAMIRLGYRGYESGKLVEDEYARDNLAGAAAAGLKIGAYFFSQALTFDEVEEELQFMLDVLGEHYLAMPLVLDWEIPTATARTANMDARMLTDMQLYFCQRATGIGYKPMIYFNWHQSEHLYYLHELEDYPFWLALYQDRMTYPWDVEMWQYTSSGKVPGIPGPVDINVYMPY